MTGRGGPRGRGGGGGEKHHHHASSTTQEGRSSSAKRTADPAGVSHPLAGEDRSKNKNDHTEGDGWQKNKSQREKKQEQFKDWETQRRIDHPDLYEICSDYEVRQILKSRRTDQTSSFQDSRGSRGGASHGSGSRGSRGSRGSASHGSARGGVSSYRGSHGGGAGGKSSHHGGNGHPSGERSGQGSNPPSMNKRKNEGGTGVTPPAKSAKTSSYVIPKLGSVGTKTWAKVVGTQEVKKKREHFPWMLNVHTGLNEKCAVTEADFKEVAMNLRKQVLAHVLEEEHVQLRTAFTLWSKTGMGLIACRNEETQKWYMEAISKIDIKGVKYRAWTVRDDTHLRNARVTVSGLGLKASEILTLIKSLNPQVKGEMILKNEEVYCDPKWGDSVMLGIDDTVAACFYLKEAPWVVELGSDERSVSYHGTRNSLIKRLDVKAETRELADLLREQVQAPISVESGTDDEEENMDTQPKE
jgi:hypothetical protein